ncbi:hypothetical protein, partial [Caballeronia sp. BR00000012568055]|uniref:hypothetical protein n=1 Tax=Caballeronia sp. BR00000012568055 TaxID=2918761 RepID=UPI0023F7AFA5
MDRLIHVATTKETNRNAKKECAANHNAKHTATNQAGDLIALKTNCFGIFLSRKTDAQVGCPARKALDGFRCSIEQGQTARGETLSSRLDKAWRKQLYAEEGRLSGRNTYRDAFRRCVQDAGMKLNVREAG